MWRYADIRTMPDIVRHWATETPAKRALTYGDREVSYRDLDKHSNRIARAIQASGAEPGTAIGFLAKNSIEFFEVWFGALKAGCSIAPFNWRSTAHELARIIDDARPPLLFTSEEFAAVASEAQEQLDHPLEIVSFDPDKAEGDALGRWLAGHDATDPWVELPGTRTALLAYTSGTTGRPKGVQLTHEAFQRSFLCLALEPALTWTSNDTLLMVMPSFHLAGSWVSIPALYHGGTISILPMFDPASTMAVIAEQRPTVTCLVPAAIQMILDHPDAGATDFSSIRSMLYAGSPIGPETLRRAIALFDCELNQFYGTTETWIICLLRPEQHDPSRPATLTSCGTPMPFVEIRIVDPEGNEVPAGTIGEFHVRSPVMFSGYLNRPEDTASVVVDGWYQTGDLGRVDAEGNYYVVDRAKDMIISGGENIYSAEVERTVAQHPAIASVAVVGAPDQKWGERVTAFVTLQPGARTTEAEIQEHCRQLIARYKVPKVVRIEDSLPTTPSGKIQKAALRTMLANEAENGGSA